MEKKRVMLAIPAGSGHITARLGQMLAHAGSLSLDPDHPFKYDVFLPECYRPVEYARNICVEAFLSEPDIERLFFIDADMVPSPMWWGLLGHDRDAVSGLAFGWGKPRNMDGGNADDTARVLTVAYNKAFPRKYFSVPIRSWKPFEVDAVGAACLVLSRALVQRVADALGPAPDDIEKPRGVFMTRYGSGGWIEQGEDIDFFERAEVRVLVDPRFLFGHLKEVDLNHVADFRYIESMRVTMLAKEAS